MKGIYNYKKKYKMYDPFAQRNMERNLYVFQKVHNSKAFYQHYNIVMMNLCDSCI